MGGMVGGDNTDTPVTECFAQHKLVDRCLDGRIDLYFTAQLLVVKLSKIEMAHRCLSRYFCDEGIARHGIWLNQFQLFCGRNMSNMKACAVFFCQFYGFASRCQTSFLTTYQCMQRYLRVIPPGFLGLCHIAVDDGRILTMYHQWQLTCFEDPFQSILTVYKHVARR